MLGLSVLLAPDARADILLDGHQHIGDTDSTTLQPGDPVTRRQHFQSPTNFHLSSAITVTAVQLNGLAGTADPAKLRVRINGILLSTSLSGDTLMLPLSSSLPLAGNRVHTIAIDPGCSGTTPGNINTECPSITGNDIGFSAITLKTNPLTQTTTSTNLVRRRHIGRNPTETNNYAGNFYPDVPQCDQPPPAVCSIVISFLLSAPQRLTQLRFYRLRNVDTRSGAVPAQVVLDGAIVLGSLSQNQDPFRINTNTVLFAGMHTLTIRAGTDRNGAPDDISWDDINLLYTFDSNLLPGAFNAVDTGANGVTGRLQTKVAGSAFAVDLIALNATRDAQQAGYAGTVSVDLLDASDVTEVPDPITRCSSRWSVAQPLGNFTFATGDGRQPVTGIVYGNALRIVRFRITQSDGAIRSCSADSFSMRPAAFNLALSGPAAAASYTAASVPTHRAGRPFTVQATATLAGGSPATNYNGQPTLVALGSMLGANLGVISADNWVVSGGIAQTDNARYSEAGVVTIRATDAQFASIDVDDTSLAGDADDAGRTAAGQINAGRFIPDHFTFTVVLAELTAGCASFTYAGQPLIFAMQPVGHITAEAFGGTTTVNYDSDSGLYKLPANLPQSTYSVYDDPAIAGTPAIDLTTVPADDNDVIEIGDGVAEVRLTAGSLALQRPANPAPPYPAEIQINLGALGEPDGVDFDPGTPGRFGEAAAGNGIPFTGAGSPKQIRFGRLVMDNAYGSELLPLDVPLRTEYWVGSGGSSGFAQNALDNCTSLPQANAVLTGAFVASNNISVSAMIPSTLAGGRGAIRLTAPSPSQDGQVAVTANLLAFSWLWVDGDGNNNYNELASANPSAQASFGVFKSDARRIYQREMVR